MKLSYRAYAILLMFSFVRFVAAVPATPTPAHQPSIAYQNQSVYVQGDLGYAMTGADGFASKQTTFSDSNAISASLAGGYKLNHYIAFETGFMMPLQKSKINGEDLTSYNVYGSLKLMAQPMSLPVNIFVKAGLGFLYNDTSANIQTKAQSAQTDNQWAYMGGVGAEYDIAHNMTIGLQYLAFMQRDDVKSKQLGLGPQYITATFGYKINI